MKRSVLGAAAAAALALSPGAAFACACGCGIFDVGGEAMAPTDTQGRISVFFQYDGLDQNQNREGSSKASAADNKDKRLTIDFYTLGASFMINRNWMVVAQLPLSERALTTTDDGSVFGPAGGLYTGRVGSVGDLQATAFYTGFAQDMSTGVGLGVKLPTGDDKGPTGPLGGAEFDRDTLPGTGSTDLVVAGYHVGSFGKDTPFSYFLQARYQLAVATHDRYRPGDEFDAAAGVTYSFGRAAAFDKVAPVLAILDSYRLHDSGAESDPLNTGYERVLIAPGLDLRLNRLHLYGDVEFPVYQNVNAAPVPADTSGQLVASPLYKVRIAYDF